MSGAGRSTAADALEDIGWFVIDNLPPTLFQKVVDLAKRPSSDTPHIALVSGTGVFFEDLNPALEQLRKTGASVRVMFLDAQDDVLVRRYEGTRRRHPLENIGLSEAVSKEREVLTQVKAAADVVIDTSDLNVHQLRDRVVELFSTDSTARGMRIGVVSFGFKHGVPVDVDLVFDCRFLPNPHWDADLRPQSGFDEPVKEYVLGQPETSKFLDKLNGLFELLLPAYVNEGKSYLTIAVGCTGGRHRSVVLAEEVAKLVSELGYDPAVSHRDVDK